MATLQKKTLSRARVHSRERKTLSQAQIAPEGNVSVNPECTTLLPNLKQVIRYEIGFDVHKDSIMVCIKAQLDTAEIITIHTQPFPADPIGLQEVIKFVGKYTPVAHYLMECTGIYHLPLYYALQTAFPDRTKQIVAMNPLLIQRHGTMLGAKTDPINARDMATLALYDGFIQPSYIGTSQFHELRDMIRSYHTIRGQLTRIKNHLHRTLDGNNQKYRFNFNFEWMIGVLDAYLAKEQTLREAFALYITNQKALGKKTMVVEKNAAILGSYGEIRLDQETRFLLQMDLCRFLNEDLVCGVILTRAEHLVQSAPELNAKYTQILGIPGFGSVTALTVLLELGDYTRFRGWKQLAKFCGIVPSEEDTGSHNGKRHINRFSNPNLRLALTQAAGVLIGKHKVSSEGKDSLPLSDLEAFADTIRLRKSFKSATIKIAQKMARILYFILVKGGEYDAYYESERKHLKKQQIAAKAQQSALEPIRVRCIRREINHFLVSNSELLDSKVKVHLVQGFHRVLKKANNTSDKPLDL